MTAILTHSHGLSLLDLSSGPSSSAASTPLALPSRFPGSSTPLITISPSSGHAFLWSPSVPLVWEYDIRGRRVGEMQVGKGVQVVVALGKLINGERVGLGGQAGWKVMEKGREGKWELFERIDIGEGVSHMAGSPDGAVIAAVTPSNRLVVHDVLAGKNEDLRLPEIENDIIQHLAFSTMVPNTLLIATSTELYISTINSPSGYPYSSRDPMIRRISPFSQCASPPILDLAVPPSHAGSRDEVCAVLGEDGRVSIIDLGHTESPPQMVSFGQHALDLVFLDINMLAGRTSDGEIMISDIRKPEDSATIIPTSQPIVSIHIIPRLTKSTRHSLIRSFASPHPLARQILGETRNVCNGQTPPPPPGSLISLDKGKQAIRTAEVIPRSRSEAGIKARASLPMSNTAGNLRAEGSRAVSRSSTVEAAPTAAAILPSSAIRAPSSAIGWTDQHRKTNRVVSEPPPPPLPLTSSSSAYPSRSASSASHTFARPRSRASSSAEGTHARAPPSSISPDFDEDIAEEDEDAAEEEQLDELPEAVAEEQLRDDPSLHLGWAIRDPPPSVISPATTTGSDGTEELMFLRREMARMQMDMLRMHRDVKNEIKTAVGPLVKELQDQRGMIERQQREIARLRCGS